MTFNWQCVWGREGGNSRGLFAHCSFTRLEVGVPAPEAELGRQSVQIGTC